MGQKGWKVVLGRARNQRRLQKAILFLGFTFEVILVYLEEVDRCREIPNWLQGFCKLWEYKGDAERDRHPPPPPCPPLLTGLSKEQW